jgi:hypothetical protein
MMQEKKKSLLLHMEGDREDQGLGAQSNVD